MTEDMGELWFCFWDTFVDGFGDSSVSRLSD
jgi:hypothetical protein